MATVSLSKMTFISEVCRLLGGSVVQYGNYLEITTRRGKRVHLSFRTMGTDGINPRVCVADPPDGISPPDYKLIALFTRAGSFGAVIAGRATTINATIATHPHFDKKLGRTIGRPRFFELVCMRGVINLTRFFRK